MTNSLLAMDFKWLPNQLVNGWREIISNDIIVVIASRHQFDNIKRRRYFMARSFFESFSEIIKLSSTWIRWEVEHCIYKFRSEKSLYMLYSLREVKWLKVGLLIKFILLPAIKGNTSLNIGGDWACARGLAIYWNWRRFIPADARMRREDVFHNSLYRQQAAAAGGRILLIYGDGSEKI